MIELLTVIASAAKLVLQGVEIAPVKHREFLSPDVEIVGLPAKPGFKSSLKGKFLRLELTEEFRATIIALRSQVL